MNAPASFTPKEIFLVLVSVVNCVDSRNIVRSEGIYLSKIPMAASGIELVTP
jgi:hypothetical protein